MRLPGGCRDWVVVSWRVRRRVCALHLVAFYISSPWPCLPLEMLIIQYLAIYSASQWVFLSRKRREFRFFFLWFFLCFLLRCLISSTSTRAEDKLSCGLTRRTALWHGGCWWLDTIGHISLSFCRGWGQHIFIFGSLPIQTPSGTSEGNELWFFSWSLCKNNQKRITELVFAVYKLQDRKHEEE